MTKRNANDISLLRAEIDRIDSELVRLFTARMQIAAQVAAYKRQTGMAVRDSVREAALLDLVAALSPAETGDCTRALYETILSLSRAYQERLLAEDAPLTE